MVNVFYILDFIVNYGTGSVRIREAYAGKVLQPEIKVIDRYFFVTITNLKYHANEPEMGIVGENAGDNDGEKVRENFMRKCLLI